MRVVLKALTEELRRLKASGVRSVPVSDAGLAALRAAATRERRRNASARRLVAEASGAAEAAGAATAAPSGRGAPAPAARPPASTAFPARPATPRPEAAASADSADPAAAASSGEVLPPPPVVALPEGDKLARWEALRAQVLGDPVCRAHVRAGKQVVFGVGSVDARIMFVGEAPGAEEEVQGEPFVGPAGQLLTKMIAAMGLSRAQVYIGNIMVWRPQLPVDPNGVQYGNRPPTDSEMAYCMPYLLAQIDVVAPAIIVALGATAARGLLGAGTFKALGEVRGQWREFARKPLIVTYHPSYILRNPTLRSKRMIWDDLLKVMDRAGIAATEKQRGYFLQ